MCNIGANIFHRSIDILGLICYNIYVLRREYKRTTKEGDTMCKADDLNREGDEAEMNTTIIQRLIEYLRSKGWTDEMILDLISYLTRR